MGGERPRGAMTGTEERSALCLCATGENRRGAERRQSTQSTIRRQGEAQFVFRESPERMGPVERERSVTGAGKPDQVQWL